MSLREKPILMSASMVRALLAGTKSQTRRIVKPQPSEDFGALECGYYHPTVIDKRGEEQPGPETFGAWTRDGEYGWRCPHGQPGTKLWVREAHWWFEDERDPVTGYFPPKLTVDDVVFRADGDDGRKVWRPSIHMPRWASRITLEVTGVRVERLQDISEADAVAEGLQRTPDGFAWHVEDEMHRASDPRESYWSLWQAINGAGSVEANPWVWCVEFRVIHA
jgi:hypothetical protein